MYRPFIKTAGILISRAVVHIVQIICNGPRVPACILLKLKHTTKITRCKVVMRQSRDLDLVGGGMCVCVCVCVCVCFWGGGWGEGCMRQVAATLHEIMKLNLEGSSSILKNLYGSIWISKLNVISEQVGLVHLGQSPRPCCSKADKR